MGAAHVVAVGSLLLAWSGVSPVLPVEAAGAHEAGERAVGGDNVTLRRVLITGYVDGLKAGSNSLYEQVWMTELRDFNDDGHLDGIQDEGAGDWTVRYSKIERAGAPGNPSTNDAVFIKFGSGFDRQRVGGAQHPR